MPAIAVIADDLTGAADTAVAFLPVAGPFLLCGVETLQTVGENPCDTGIALFTGSRNLPEEAAGARIAKAADYVKSKRFRVVYKKVDSTLRGNIGAETDILVSMLGCRAGFVAPALPAQGRITLHDLHMVNGVPVAESEAGRDPLSPVAQSRLSGLLSSQSRSAVGHVDVEVIEKGAAALSRRIASLLEDGCRQIAFDAASNEHLAAIAAVARGTFRDCLLVGSAGLAEGLAQTMADEGERHVPVWIPAARKPLFVCGSASAKLAAQRETLSQLSGVPSFLLESGELASYTRSATMNGRADRISSRWREGGMILAVARSKEPDTGYAPQGVLWGFADVAAEVIEEVSPDLVFLSGGDTAGAVLKRIGVGALCLYGSPLPGLAWGVAASGKFKGLSVVTKAGSFGAPDTLARLYAMIIKKESTETRFSSLSKGKKLADNG